MMMMMSVDTDVCEGVCARARARGRACEREFHDAANAGEFLQLEQVIDAVERET